MITMIIRKLLMVGFVALAFLILPGFNLDRTLVPKEKILSGGVPKDGIPAILEPRFIPANRADFPKPNDEVIGVTINGTAKAYPIKILNFHEVVNDSFGDIPVVVTF